MKIVTEQSITKRCTIPVTFRRGKELSDDGFVQALLMKKFSADTVQMIGEVEGSHGNTVYHTFVKLKRSGKGKPMTIGDGSCECKAFIQYNGFCKHLVATLLDTNFYVEEEQVNRLLDHGSIGESCNVMDVEEDDGIDEQSLQERLDQALSDWMDQGVVQKGMPVATASGRSFSNVPQTWSEQESSKELLDAISGMALQERNHFCQELADGDVELEVTLHLEPDEEKIELRIGKEQKYVVKDIPQLLQDIREQQTVTYGKKLSFLHTLRAFSKESGRLVSLLLTAPAPRPEAYMRWYKADNRYQKLDPRMLEELLRIYSGKRLAVVSCLQFDKMSNEIVAEDPKLPVIISGMPGGKEAEIVFPEILMLEGIQGFSIWWENTIYQCTPDYCREMRELIKLMAVNYPYTERQREHGYGYHPFVKKARTLTLCQRDYTSFCSTVLPVLQRYTKLLIEEIDFSSYQMEEGRYEIYLDLTENKQVVCRAKAIYGEKEHNLIQMASVTETYRDLRYEYEIRTLLERYFPGQTSDGEQYLLELDDDRLADLIEYGVDELGNLADVYISDAFKQIRITTNVNMRTGLSIKGNLLKVDWDIQGMSKEELHAVLSAYHRKKRYYRLRSGELLNLAQSGIGALAELEQDLHLTKAQLKAGSAEVPLYRALYLNALMKDNARKLTITKDEMFERFIHNYEELSTKQYAVPDQIQATLRSYQLDGYQWASTLSAMGFGGILADDMGLGKTLQMITYMASRKGMIHLVVCPASLVYNWEAEFERFAPHMRVCAVVGTAAERQKLLEDWCCYDVLITSYDLLKRDIDSFAQMQFDCQIIDEAQYIKNPSTQAAKAVKTIKSRTRFALTGTPIENRLSELWSIFEYLMPGYLYSYKYFKEHFEQDILEKTQKGEDASKRLHQMIAPFLLRRLKKDVLQDLPDKVEKTIYTRFGREQEKLYKAAEKNIVSNLKKNADHQEPENKIQVLAELTRLRQICCDPGLLYENYHAGSAKLEVCMEVLRTAIGNGHRILLFSQFTSMLDEIGKQLRKQNISYFVLTGATSKVKRRELVEQFQQGDVPVFLISLKAGGTGLNLTAADVVIHYDPWWNVAAQNQATDRTHRIGQDKDVTVFKLIAKDTIEERILKLQENKRDLADQIISQENLSLSSLTREDLMELFQNS